jgi:hypothetical protein
MNTDLIEEAKSQLESIRQYHWGDEEFDRDPKLAEKILTSLDPADVSTLAQRHLRRESLESIARRLNVSLNFARRGYNYSLSQYLGALIRNDVIKFSAEHGAGDSAFILPSEKVKRGLEL